ncbi:hypothetical protein GYMLUDRAFT_248017 [Collybiopsis luxurians FD-317 M1]|uniref:Unplaced genomic scaffold GYMLUscaffold_51, whole genome shotgun sequence n=1 Tax=Collybiopsis luxurians FD-317 M1 TaxID=944289 RepID=A0A0D0AZU5_9AGAR|nr:hypothetical protein GYMLUDRAFT_248017 [Collybiopsis luxurians FD-317 M1]
MSVQIFEFNPAVEDLQSLIATKRCSNHHLWKFADLILKALQCYDERRSRLHINLLIVAVYEFGAAKIESGAKTDPCELDKLERTLSIITSGEVTSDVHLLKMHFKQEILKVENSSFTMNASTAPFAQSPSISYQGCYFYQAERDIHSSKINDHSVKSNCYNRSNHELNANLQDFRKPRQVKRLHRASGANKTREKLRTHIQSRNFGLKSHERRANSKLAGGRR